MSRLGKLPIKIPTGTTAALADAVLTVKGKGGELQRTVAPQVIIEIKDNEIIVAPKKKEEQLSMALWGTFAAHVRNMVAGVNTPFEKKLVVEGVGYRVNHTGNTLTLSVGFSHPVVITIPAGVDMKVEKNNITISGIDKEVIGQFAADIRRVKPPEPYKGKGIRYSDEVVRRKQGKKAGAGA
jgi:large subunit ribosomal protein L6